MSKIKYPKHELYVKKQNLTKNLLIYWSYYTWIVFAKNLFWVFKSIFRSYFFEKKESCINTYLIGGSFGGLLVILVDQAMRIQEFFWLGGRGFLTYGAAGF